MVRLQAAELVKWRFRHGQVLASLDQLMSPRSAGIREARARRCTAPGVRGQAGLGLAWLATGWAGPEASLRPAGQDLRLCRHGRGGKCREKQRFSLRTTLRTYLTSASRWRRSRQWQHCGLQHGAAWSGHAGTRHILGIPLDEHVMICNN